MSNQSSDSHHPLSDVARQAPPPTLRIRRSEAFSTVEDDPQTLSFAGLDSDMSVKLPRAKEVGVPMLVQLGGADIGRCYPLTGELLYVGRDSGRNDIVLPTNVVSRAHARIRNDDDGYRLEDLNSKNGTFVNLKPATKEPLQSGDLVHFGRISFKFLEPQAPEAIFHREMNLHTVRDPLSGVFSRIYLDTALERERCRAEAHRRVFSLLLFSIDGLRTIVERAGELAGDELIRELCRSIEPRVSGDATLARFSGNKFVLLLPEIGLREAVMAGDGLREAALAVETKHCPRGTLTLSVGVTAYDPELPVESWEPLLMAAGVALRDALVAGGDSTRKHVLPPPS